MKRCICEPVDTDWWGLCSGVESSMTQGMSGLELEAALPFDCPEFWLPSGQSVMGHLTGVLSPFLNCDLGTGAWEIAEAPLGSHTMQVGTSTSPWLLLHCSHIPFPSTLTCADVRLLVPYWAQEPCVSLARGQRQSGKLHICVLSVGLP